ncbi:MAG TPA: phosphatidate cytidylyltransferase, partial [Bacteroidia bacterium]|nr:phosphatidate cytidylyltransferase [Bacteroidia bacterium]
MEKSLLFLIALVFGIGAGAIVVIHKDNPNSREARALWLKYGIYLLVVSVLVFCLLHAILFPFLACLLVGLGAFEIYALRKNLVPVPHFLFLASLLFLLLAGGFIYYSFQKNNPGYLCVYLLVFCFDGFSQISGQLFGKHSLAPKTSPNKT